MHVDKETYVPGKYSWSPAGKDELRWQTIPRQSVISVYKHYFADFGKIFYFSISIFTMNFSVLFGYSPEDVLSFINASNPNKQSASKELQQQSAQNLNHLFLQYFRKNQDFYC